jgi:hypothetical protein
MTKNFVQNKKHPPIRPGVFFLRLIIL